MKKIDFENILKRDSLLKLLLSSIIIAILLFFIYFILYKTYCEGHINDSEITFFIGSIKDVFQILFFFVVGCITILSYHQARKTLFTPIKTETFKMQIKAFEEILAFFQTKSETDFTSQFDFHFIVQINAQLMFSEYIENFFNKEIKIDQDKLNELRKKSYGGILTQSWAEKHLIAPEYYEKTKIEEKEDVTNPAIILENWKSFEYGPIHYSKKYHDENEKLNQLIASPLIPTELKNKLEKFGEIISENILSVGESLNEIAQELPQKFKTAKSIKNLEQSGLWNKCNDKMKPVEPIAKDILIYIRNYLKIDKLID